MHTSDSASFAWLLASKITSVKAHQWVELEQQHKTSLFHLMSCSQAEWLAYGLSEKQFQQRTKYKLSINKALDKVEQTDIQIITFEDAFYPARLKALTQPPCVLFVLGDKSRLNMRQIGIVGSRHASRNGVLTAQSIASDLANMDIQVISGLARGIDAAAHKGALSKGDTIAVLGTGVDICYPKFNQRLRDEIVEHGGTLVSEFFPGTPPRAHHFPCRNRIVAGLSMGILVIEAKIRSGSLITANLAADMGKEVFAVPGNINHPLSEGVNWLIQQGAKLVTNTADIVEEFGFFELVNPPNEKTVEKPLASDPILDSVDYDVTVVDDIAKRSKLPVQEILAVLLEYELRGIVAAVPGGYIKLRGK